MRFPLRVTDWKALKYLIIPIVKSRRAWNWWKNKKDVNGQNSPVETFQSVREDNLFKQTVHSGEVPVGQSKYAYLLSVWNHRNFHVNGKQPCTLIWIFLYHPLVLINQKRKFAPQIAAKIPSLKHRGALFISVAIWRRQIWIVKYN
jgi:hypothetical protein